MKTYKFSLIELLTVITVILIFMTLLVPTLNKLKMKARIVICAQNLKQLGVLMSTYSNDNDGLLPYTRNNPYYSSGSYSYKDRRGYGRLYGSWAGHLIPYLNVELPSWSRGSYYHDKAKGYPSLNFYKDIDDIAKDSNVLSDENYGNWKLLHDMYYEGGYAGLKTLICPEATKTYYTSFIKQNRFVPRISGVLPTKWSSSTLIGCPSSYLCNGQLFGSNANQSQRYEDFNKTNFLLLEGCNNTDLSTPADYRKFFELSTVYGGAVNNVISGWSKSAQNPNGSARSMAASFFHDSTEEIWYSWRGYMPTSSIQRYNKLFYPYAASSYMWDRPEGKSGILVANQYPGEKWQNFEAPFTKGKFSIYRYYSADLKPTYLFGEMNLLIGDLSVKKAHLGWMFENARTLGQDVQ
ncbi:MAG: hypothetical protein COA79_22100 [Planctomycetota bacterium]|nr:MAG: hypothetical protein COA79_22100 [Planctomycetota bacterium]